MCAKNDSKLPWALWAMDLRRPLLSCLEPEFQGLHLGSSVPFPHPFYSEMTEKRTLNFSRFPRERLCVLGLNSAMEAHSTPKRDMTIPSSNCFPGSDGVFFLLLWTGGKKAQGRGDRGAFFSHLLPPFLLPSLKGTSEPVYSFGMRYVPILCQSV